jgi:hypothetical protein
MMIEGTACCCAIIGHQTHPSSLDGIHLRTYWYPMYPLNLHTPLLHVSTASLTPTPSHSHPIPHCLSPFNPQASSGINSLNLEGGDSADLFHNDTWVSGGGMSDAELVEVLVVSEGIEISVVEWRVGYGVGMVVWMAGETRHQPGQMLSRQGGDL